jgi:hypothetical protein
MPVAEGDRGDRAGTAPLVVAAARSAVIKVWPVMAEDRAGGHAPGTP